MPDDARDPAVLTTSITINISGLDEHQQEDLARIMLMENEGQLGVDCSDGMRISVTAEDISRTRALVNSTMKWLHCSMKIRGSICPTDRT